MKFVLFKSGTLNGHDRYFLSIILSTWGGIVLHAKCRPVRSIELISRYFSSLIILGEVSSNPNIYRKSALSI